MFISLGEIIIIVTLSLVALKPNEIVSIMHRMGNIVRTISERYNAVVAEVKNWWNKR